MAPLSGRSRAPRQRTGARVLPVTLLSGFLGSGKTSLLRHLLMNRDGLRVAVIVNEISEINMDAVALEGAKVLETEERVVEMSNGCICCTLREDLLKTLRSLHRQKKYDAVLVESSGIAEPLQVAETFFVDAGDGHGVLQETCPLDNCVTVVDASTLRGYLGDTRLAAAVDPKALEEKGDQSISELLLEQVEFANVVVVNKVDLVGGAESEAVRELVAMVRGINPRATVLPVVRGAAPLDAILQTKNFSLEFAQGMNGWMADIDSGVAHTPETLEYGVSSFLYRADRPFHAGRLYDWMEAMFFWKEIVVEAEEEEEGEEEGEKAEEKEGGSVEAEEPVDLERAYGAEETKAREAAYGTVFRSKGFVWVGAPGRLDAVAEWSQAGGLLSFGYGGQWSSFEGGSGGRRVQRLVFIGQHLKKEALQRDLDALLLTEEEFAAVREGRLHGGEPWADPFAPFPVVDGEGDGEGEGACGVRGKRAREEEEAA